MILRSLLLFLSNRRDLRQWMEVSPLAGRLKRRFIAGETLADALEVTARLNRECVLVTVDRLGENVTNLEEAVAPLEGYLEAVGKFAALDLPASVSIKLTQLGLDVSGDACRRNVSELIERAKDCGRWVEIDMESSEYVDRTLKLVTEMHARYANVRYVIQAYLRRSAADIETMSKLGVPVRLCKGAYKEPASVAFQKKSEVDASYLRLMKVLLERGVYPAIATHDEAILEATISHARERGISASHFEFQMLYGIRRDLEKKLVQQGYRLRLYVPYGEAWYPYFMRRLAERPANVMFLLRNLVRG